MVAVFHIFEAEQVANWLEHKEKDVYWSVDGDPKLEGRLSFPCPANELADELRKIGKKLLVHDRDRRCIGNYSPLLSTLVSTNDLGHPTLAMTWGEDDDWWLMIQDIETTKSVREKQSKLKNETSFSVKVRCDQIVGTTFGPFEKRKTAEKCVLNLSCRENIYAAEIIKGGIRLTQVTTTYNGRRKESK